MAFSSLADELAGAFIDGPPPSPSGNLGSSLADEFGLDYELEGERLGDDILNEGELERDLDYELENPSTPPGGLTNLPQLHTPNHNLTRTAKSSFDSYAAPNLDEISPNRGIDLDLDLDLDLELELQLREGHSFLPHQNEFELEEEVERKDELLGFVSSPSKPRERGVRNKSSNRSLRPQYSIGYFQRNTKPDSNKMGEDSLIILSECIATSSRLLDGLREINGNGQVNDKGNGNYEKNNSGNPDDILEDRLQAHLNKMVESEKKRDEWIRELNILSVESGFGLDNNLMVDDHSNIDTRLNDLTEEGEGEETEEEGTSSWKGGWTGELDLESVTDQHPPLRQSEMKNSNRIVGHEQDEDEETISDEHVNPHDALLDDFAPDHYEINSFSSSHSLRSPITPPTSHSTIRSPSTQPHHHPKDNKEQNLPNLLSSIALESKDLISLLAHLNNSLHTISSYNTSNSRQIKNIKSSLESYKQRENIELEAKIKIEQYEENKLKIGLTHGNNNKNEDGDENCFTLKDKLNKECLEFEKSLNSFGEKLELLRMNTSRSRAISIR